MTLTLEKPETGARLLRFAQKRGMPLDDLIDDLLDGAEEKDDEDWKEDLSTIPDILKYPEPDALKRALEDMDAGKGISGADFLAELRRPVEEIPAL
ncbi:hypothetical protein [Armatimonas sp.]|uniref:hypothetical protein n=1 Tax=Armatimonas sp. TaxID=1872638 RepID=UPI003751F6E7